MIIWVIPHSLKDTTISAIMDEIAKGDANLSHLAIQGNYRAAAAHDMGNAYSRNLAQRKIFLSKLAKKATGGNQTAESLTAELPEFSEKNQGGDKSLNAEILGKPADWALAVLKQRGPSRRPQKRPQEVKGVFRGSCRTKWAVGSGQLESQDINPPRGKDWRRRRDSFNEAWRR